MTNEEVEIILNENDIFDRDILEHGFTKNNRDYKIIVGMPNDESYEFYFVGCVELNYKNILPKQDLYLDELPTEKDIERFCEEDGGRYLWVEFSVLYPGLEIIDNSSSTEKWEKLFSKSFHHIRITTNVFELEIVFNKIKVIKLKTV